MHSIFEEITWPQFQNLDGIRQLSLNEQMHRYNQYLSELSLARDYYYQFQVKGPQQTSSQTGFLQQENLFYILQEDGGKIIIT